MPVSIPITARRALCPGGPLVSPLGFGSIPLGKATYETAAATLNRALDLGVNLVDTSWNYGESEAHIGRAVAHRRREFVLVTKTGKRRAGEARAELELSLQRLRTDHIDVLLLHSVSALSVYEEVMGPGGALEALRQAQQEGLIGHIGISIHRDLRAMRRAIEAGAFDVIMLVYNIIDQENTAGEMLSLAQRQGLGVMVMKALGGGGMVPALEAGFSPGERDRVIRDAIRYVLHHEAVRCVPVGFANPAQVDLAVEAAGMPALSGAEVEQLRADIGRMRTRFRYGQVCLRCGYCQPCPQKVPIADVFRAADAYAGYPEGVRSVAEGMFEALDFKAGQCTGCGACLPRCPAGIDIPRRLQVVSQAFAEKRPELLSAGR